MTEPIIKITNPFSVNPVLERRRAGILKIAISEDSASREHPSTQQAWHEIASSLRKNNIGIPVETTSEPFSYAEMTPKPPVSIESLFAKPKGLWIALDLVEDHRNLGMILRSAGFYGVSGVLIKVKDPAFRLSQEIVMNSSGGLEGLDYAFCTSFSEARQILQDQGFSVVIAHVEQGVDMASGKDCNDKVLVILGNEYNGLSEESVALATHRICIPFAEISSVNCLNVAVCTGVIIDRFRDKIH